MHHLKTIVVFALLRTAYSSAIHVKLPELNVTSLNVSSHLELRQVQRLCATRGVCKSDSTRVCAVRRARGDFEHRDFENWCYLLMYNMCDHPEHEYAIAYSGSCAEYLKTRRMYVYSGVTVPTAPPSSTTAGAHVTTEGATTNTTKPGRDILRTDTFSKVYDIYQAFDFHMCPLSCSNVYSPVCLNANRDNGKFMKFWTFVNHCEGDRYYCKNWRGVFEREPLYGQVHEVLDVCQPLRGGSVLLQELERVRAPGRGHGTASALFRSQLVILRIYQIPAVRSVHRGDLRHGSLRVAGGRLQGNAHHGAPPEEAWVRVARGAVVHKGEGDGATHTRTRPSETGARRFISLLQ